jgi:nucleoside phosphorylase
VTTLVVGAWAPELDGLDGHGLELRELGVGLVDASLGAAHAIAETRPDLVILVGTAGALPNVPLGPPLVVVARSAKLVVRELEYAPAPMALVADADVELSSRLAARLGVPLVDVASPVGVTSSDREAARLAEAGAEIEQLECFALFRAAARARVPAVAIFAIANRVGESAATEWKANRVRAEAAAKEALLRAITAVPVRAD